VLKNSTGGRTPAAHQEKYTMTQPVVADVQPEQEKPPTAREVNYEHSLNLAPLLEHLRVTLLVSTYQAGKLVVVSAREGKPDFAFHSFERAMGVAARPDRLAVGARAQIWLLRSAPDIAARLAARGYDACYLTRAAHFTGDVHVHEMAWVGDELWFVNTMFSCLSTLHDNFSFVPRWKPPFITNLAAEDRCHLNGLGLVDGKPRYVTFMAETNEARGWRPHKVSGGCLMDLATNEVIARGFAMPHSPRVANGRLWLLDSGRGRLVTVDPKDGRVETVAELPGYTRGLALTSEAAFVGLSRIRETSTFGGVPIAEKRDQLKCGVGIVQLTTGNLAALLEFKSGVEEVFDVQVLPRIRRPLISGPFAGQDGSEVIWTVPQPGKS
jgi:uncharacterized protein (TIGR03032 family)